MNATDDVDLHDKVSPHLRKSVALKYNKDDQAPKVLSSATGEMAERMVALAREYGIATVKDTLLVELLSVISAGSPIPPESYRVVAELLAFLYRTDATFRQRHGFMAPAMQKRKSSPTR